MKNTIKVLGIIALAAVIGFSMAGCKNDDDGGGGLSAPTGLYATSPSANSLQVGWNSVSGATGYILYISADNFRTTDEPVDMYYLTYLPLSDVASGTYYFRVAAYNANGTVGAKSNIVFVTVTGSSGGGPIIIPQPNTSIIGVWEFTSSSSTVGGGKSPTPGIQHEQITVSGNTGRLTRRSYSPLEQDAINKGYYDINSIMWRNLTSTGNLKWSGQILAVLHRTSTPDIASAAQWYNCTITMSANGQTITIVTPWSYENSSGTLTETYTRK